MDNKLSELSKPKAFVVTGGKMYQDRAFTDKSTAERSKVDRHDGAVVEPLYSQEYVSALLAENERVASDLVARNGEIEGLRKRAAELEAEITNIVDSHAETVAELRAKLATPVRLPEGTGWASDPYNHGHNTGIHECSEAIRAAGFTVEGDE